MKVRIFVSYCHDDVKPDNDRLKVFIDALQSAGKGMYEILADYEHSGAAIGANLPAYMRQIDNADAAIVLLTPGYKQRVMRKGATGVYVEFRRIYNRLLATEEDKSYGQSFTLFPIVFTNTFEEGCPVEINYLVSKDLAWLHIVPGTLKVRREIRAQLDHFVEELTDRIAAIAATKRKLYVERQKDLFRDFLFGDTKSRWDIPENYRYLDSTFVKTATFLRARNREVSFVIGRKGAGKSTITHVLPVLSIPPPAEVLQIDFEQLPWDMCYNILRSHPAEASDLRHTFSPIYSYQLLWDLFLHLFFAWAVSDKLPRNSKPRQLIRRLLDKPLKKTTEPSERNAVATNVLFVFAFEKVVAYVDLLMRRKATEGGLSATFGDFSPTNFRTHVLGLAGWQSLQNYLGTYEPATDRVIITADGFDTMVGYFTMESADTAKFEREILLALFQIVLNKGPAKVGGSKLYRQADFCIAIPFDRFYEVRARDRDRFKYRHRSTRIAWSGMELSALVRKRLALLRGIKDQKGKSLEDRLAAVMKNGYPELPDEVAFQFGSAPYRLPLFIYVLRHTFWRPRDVLFYYSSLLAASEAFGKKRATMPSGFVRQVIAGATRSIIEDEFLAEFSSTFRNLPQVVRAFRHGPQVLSWSELKRRLDAIKFETTLPEDGVSSLAWKVTLLYDMGMIGVFLDRHTSERFSSLRHAFSFNEPQLLREELGQEDYPQFDYILHPVFCEYLHLDTSDNELILAMDWEYLHKNEILRGIVPP